MRVLVVDGDYGERKAIVETLAAIKGATVVGAVPDLDGAIRVVAEVEPDVVVTGDALESGRDAYALVEAIRHGDDAPAIVVVGDAAERAAWHSHARGIHFVARERGYNELTVVVDAILRWPRVERAETLLRLTEGAAHDTPIYLDAITATLALSERDPSADVHRREARAMIDQSLRLSAAMNGYIRGDRREPVPVDLGPLVRRTALVAQRAVESPVAVVVETAADVGHVRGVASELEQLVLNLVLTVRAWIPDHKELTVRVVREGSFAVLSLSSNGDRRTTTNPVRSARTGSLGIVRAIMQRHDAVMVIAPGLAGGTTIRVSIPTS